MLGCGSGQTVETGSRPLGASVPGKNLCLCAQSELGHGKAFLLHPILKVSAVETVKPGDVFTVNVKS